MKRLTQILSALLLAQCLFALNLGAQTQVPFNAIGVVKDEMGEPMKDVLVDLKESLTFTTTNENGFFSIRITRLNSEIMLAAPGYQTVTVKVADASQLNITLMKDNSMDDPAISVMYGKQKKSHIVGAVSTVFGEDIEDIPVIFQNTAISGKLTGVHTIQESGAPAGANADLYLRGRRSWNNRNPLIYVDGHEREFSTVDAHEIEQISAYKDAAALSIFGLQGANGAIMATTKRGIVSRPILSFNSQLSFESPTQMPEFVDSYDYAMLYNEARVNDGLTPIYSDEDIQKYKDGSDPLLHPNVDWLDEFMKDYSITQKYNMSLRGGDAVARYFVNMSFNNNDGLYNTDKSVNTYNTNAGFKTYSIRSNVDVNLTKTLLLSVDLYGRQRIQTNPGGSTSTNAMFNLLYSIPSNKFPINYGSDKVAGVNEFQANPYGLLNYSGYSQYIHSTMEATMKAEQKLDFITKGLSVYGSLAFDMRFDNTITRSKKYLVYQYTGDDANGDPLYTTWGEESAQSNTNAFGASKIRIFDTQVGLNYNRVFGRHDVTGLLLASRNQKTVDTATSPIANIHQGFAGRVSYAFADKYLIEGSFAYQGTEQLPEENRYGFFPSIALGYVLSNENFIKNTAAADYINFLKFRGSYGLVGNDDGLPSFYYLPSFKLNSNSRYNFGATGVNVPGWIEDGLYNSNVTWEQSEKMNAGVDATLFKHLHFTGDYFTERTTQILTTRTSVSTLLGVGSGSGPQGNVGETFNRGFELELSWSGGKNDFYYNIGANLTNVHNKIIFNDEQTYAYAYRVAKNNSINRPTGYVADGLYIDEQDLLNSPATTFGKAYAGDIKYRDLNGDGTVDIDDQRYIGLNNLPELYGAVFADIRWKGFDLSGTFTFVGERTYYAKSVGIYAFYNVSGVGGQYDGNVQKYHLENRYNPADPSTWETATYPRLSLAGRTHNTQSSSFWLEDGNFCRLKDIEFGYTIPRRITQRFHVSKLRAFYSGYNLLTWHNMRTVAPESAPNGNNYPVQKTHSFGINVQF